MQKYGAKKAKARETSLLARQLGLIFFTIFICITVVLLAISLDLAINSEKTWSDSLFVRWIIERRQGLNF
ncbi:MAG: hypothetical protein VB045_09080 [Synergistaceae bacterium]|nr:hypothetical protein [Synergistaceae bacterium]